MSTESATRRSPGDGEFNPVAAQLARNRLGTLSIASYVLSATAFLTVVAGVIPSAFATTAIIGIGLAFVVVGSILALFAVGFTYMSRSISNAGAFYAYVAQGLGRIAGVAVAFVATLAYSVMQVGLYGVFGFAIAPLANPVIGVEVPWWGWSLAALALVSVLGFQRVDLNGRILGLLMMLEIVAIIVLDVANLLNPADGTLGMTAFEPGSLLVPEAGAALVVAITGFVGFEAAAIFSEEARDTARTVPRATFLCLAVIAVLYSVSAWAMSEAIGPADTPAVTARKQGETLFDLAAMHLGPEFVTILRCLFVTSVFAGLVSYHVAVGRYVFALGRERVLWSLFRSTTRHGAPKWGSVLQSTIGLVVITFYAVMGLDPMIQLFYWGGTIGAYGLLWLITITAVAVIAYHRRHGADSLWRGLIAPAVAFVLLLAVLATATANLHALLGTSWDSPLPWSVLAVYLVVATIGVIRGEVLRRRQPDVYRTIGLGAKSDTGRLTGVDPAPAAQTVEPR